jgi:hypothetical protein
VKCHRCKRNPVMSLEQATSARLSEIRDILRSGAGEYAGKAMREDGEGQEGQGRVIGRHRGYSSMYPELQKYAYPRSTILRALEKKSGKVYDNLYRASKDVMEYHGYMGRRQRARGPLTEAPHSSRRPTRCKHCYEMHTKGEHRFHGAGAYHKTHLFSFGGKMNPGGKKLVLIYERVIRVIAKKGPGHKNCDAECKRCHHEYFHDFKAGARMYGFPNGDILIKKG